MNDRNIADLLSDFYDAKRLDPERVAEIQQLVAQARGANDAPALRSGGAFRLAPWLSAAAAFLLTVTAVLLYEGSNRTLSTLYKKTANETVETIRSESLPGADIIVLKFSADWCRPSMEMAPMYAELSRDFDTHRVLFVELDLTDTESIAQSKYLVMALGIENVWNVQGGITGELLYVDASTREIISTFNAEHDYEQMNFALADALTERGGST